MNTNCYLYAVSLLKRKNYFTNEIRSKLLLKYNINDVNKTTSRLIKEGYINDVTLCKLKINNYINIYNKSRRYIINYLQNKNINKSLIKYIMKLYSDEQFIENIKNIIDKYERIGKDNKYIYQYLLRNGFENEDIKKLIKVNL